MQAISSPPYYIKAKRETKDGCEGNWVWRPTGTEAKEESNQNAVVDSQEL